jgi:hypothetical protein
MFFPDDTHFTEPLLEEHPAPETATTEDLLLRHLVDVLCDETGWLEVTPDITPGLRERIAETCHKMIAEHQEVIQTIQHGFDEGAHHNDPTRASSVHTQAVTRLHKLLSAL